MIDFEKPIRFTDDNCPAHFIGQRLDGNFLIEEDGHPRLVVVDKDGRGVSIFWPTPIIENVPERITRWILMTPYTGYDSKEDAINVAARYEGEHCAVIRVEFEEGERP